MEIPATTESTTRPRAQEFRVFNEQIRLLQEQSKPAILLNLPLVLISLAIFWSSIIDGWLLTWAAALILLSLLRLRLFRKFTNMVQDNNAIRQWAHLHMLITSFTGALWGSMALFLLYDLSGYQENYIILVILGLTGTSISVNSSYFPNFLAFIIPAILPMELILLSDAKEIYNGFSYLLLLYLFVLVKAARATERNVRHTITLRHENQSLVYDLRRSNAELTQEIKLRESMEGQLRSAKEAAERANASKSEFISRISHELRTPLTAILGFSGILIHNKQIADSVRQDIGKINKAGHHLLKLIDDLLDISRIEAGNLSVSLEPVKLHDLLEETRGLIAPLAEKASIELDIPTVPESLYLYGDYMRLKQVLLNLLSNAVKYNRAGGSVSVQYQVFEPELIRISVIDNGVGIAADKLDQIFQPYNRLGAEKTSVQGTGIGMTITKQIMELMNGDIGVESEAGKGTQFWIELPLVSGDEQQDALPQAHLPDSIRAHLPDGFSCLYVEDNPNNVELIQRMMDHLGKVRVLSAPSAELGIELAAVHHPDLILMDINLPGMDGYKALEKLRQADENRNIPIIALSANSTNAEIERGRQAGFDDYLTKPVSMETLASAILRIFHDS